MATTIAPAQVETPARSRAAAGYAFALLAGTIWGTTGPLSTALYAEGAQLTSVGFWRILLAALGFFAYGLFQRDLFRIDRRGALLMMGIGGLFVALFEVSFQFAIAGVGIAGAVALLYTAPLLVAVLAHVFLREKLTALRVALAIVVTLGVWLTVNGNADGSTVTNASTNRMVGIVGGLLAALSFGGQTLVARYAVPRYGSARMLFYMLVGGTLLLAILLPLNGRTPQPPPTLAGWGYIAALGIGSVLLANFCFFAAVKRIDAAPTAVAASIEPFVGAALGLLLFGQQLTLIGWLGLLLVVGGVAGGFAAENEKASQ